MIVFSALCFIKKILTSVEHQTSLRGKWSKVELGAQLDPSTRVWCGWKCTSPEFIPLKIRHVTKLKVCKKECLLAFWPNNISCAMTMTTLISNKLCGETRSQRDAKVGPRLWGRFLYGYYRGTHHWQVGLVALRPRSTHVSGREDPPAPWSILALCRWRYMILGIRKSSSGVTKF